MKVREIMSLTETCIEPNDTVRMAARKMALCRLSALPVCDGNELVGLVTEHDVTSCVANGNDTRNCTVKQMLVGTPVCVTPDTELWEAMRLMAEEDIRQLCVMDKGRPTGILAMAELMTLALRVSMTNQGPL